MTLADALEELERKRKKLIRRFDIKSFLFPPQLGFVADDRKYKTAVCSRRAGKTEGCAVSLLNSAIQRPNSVSLYVTLSRKNAKRIIWRRLKQLNKQYSLGGKPNETELHIEFQNGAMVCLGGANDRQAIEDYRGLALAKVVLDEAQAFPEYIEELVDDVIEPALMDYNGSLELIGTPAPVPTGFFFNCSQNPDPRFSEWNRHGWTVFENPYIQVQSGHPPQWHLERTLKRRGVTVDDPSIQREWFGRWVYDPNALVFRFNPEKNIFVDLPLAGEKPWQYVMGVDLGYDDSDAIAVLAFHEKSPNVYLVEEFVAPKQTITALTEEIRKRVQQYKPLAIVVDTGGLGKKITEEISARTSLPLAAAEKTRKHEFIELLNDAMRTGRFYARAEGRFAHDSQLVEWDRDKSRGEKRVVSARYHSDIGDAVLYAYRESLHWLHVPEEEKPPPGSDAAHAALAKRMMEHTRQEILAAKEEANDMFGLNNLFDVGV